jgi:two-component system, cell cycle sensor histidine kinase and response regulator CckA
MLRSGAGGGEKAPGENAPEMCGGWEVLDAVTKGAILVLDRGGRVLHANRSACQLFVRSVRELENRTLANLGDGAPPHSEAQAESRIRMALDQGECTFPWCFRRGNGEGFTALTLLRPVGQGEPGWLVAIVQETGKPRLTDEVARDSEEKLLRIFQRIFQASTNAMALAEEESGRVVDVNQAWLAMCGVDRERIIGRDVFEIGPWQDPAEEHACHSELTSGGRIEPREILLASATGPRPARLSVVSVALPTGNLSLWELRDLSEVRHSQALAREREERLHAIGANLTEGMIYQVTASPEGARTITYLSDSVRRLYGVSPQEAMADANLIYRRIHPDDIERLRRAEDLAIKDCTTFRTEARLLDPTGTIRWSAFVSTPKRLADGNTVFDGIEFVITNLKRAEEALAESERDLKEAQHLAALGSWTLDLKTDRLHWSDEVFRIFELSPKTFNASLEGFLDAVHPDDRELVRRAYADSVTNRTTYSIEHRLRMPDGRIKYVQERSATYYDDDGKPSRSVGTVQDITKDKEATLERANLEAQLQRAQRMESIGRLAGGVAHDFNNMLGVIIGHVELALGELPDDHSVHANLQEIVKAARRSKDLTRQLLAFARKQTITPRVLDVNEAVKSMLRMLRRLIGEDIDLLWQPATELWPVKVDPSQLDQILVNLCVNSRDAIKDVGKITIETQNARVDHEYSAQRAEATPGEYVRLSVSDDGCGMDRETMAHIFEPFFTTKESGTGTGLGLATVYGIAHQNHGFINVYSEPGQGTTFAIYLPRDLSGKAATAPEVSAIVPLGGHEMILLVEDEPALLSVFAVMLEKYGYTVLPANGPGEALRLAAQHAKEIRLLISDVVMPGMNGRELAKLISAIVPGVKRLFMSGYTANVIAHHNVLDEGVWFIQKPFTETELATQVRRVIGGDESAASTT